MEAVARHVASRPMPAALVADVSTGAGLTALRSLARAGAPVLALDHRPGAPGLHSRHALSLRGPHPADARSAPRARSRGSTSRSTARPVRIATSGLYARALAGDDAAVRLGEGEPRRAVAACLGADGEPIALFVAERRRGTDAWQAGSPAESVAEDALELLRARFGQGLVWAELTEAGAPVEAGAYLWPGHALALAHGVDLARVGYWAALGARFPAGLGGSRHRFAGVADPGPALAAVARLARRRP